jgi:hypothetical protein
MRDICAVKITGSGLVRVVLFGGHVGGGTPPWSAHMAGSLRGIVGQAVAPQALTGSEAPLATTTGATSSHIPVARLLPSRYPTPLSCQNSTLAAPPCYVVYWVCSKPHSLLTREQPPMTTAPVQSLTNYQLAMRAAAIIEELTGADPSINPHLKRSQSRSEGTLRLELREIEVEALRRRDARS